MTDKKTIIHNDLVIRAQRGEVKALQELIEKNTVILNYYARKYMRLCNTNIIEQFDLVQEGILAIIEAMKKFNPELNCTFLTYAVYRIIYRMRELARKNPIDPIQDWQRQALNQDNISAITQETHLIELRIMINDLIEHLGPTEKMVINRRYGLNEETPQTLKVIGETLGVKRARVCQIETAALNRLQKITHHAA